MELHIILNSLLSTYDRQGCVSLTQNLPSQLCNSSSFVKYVSFLLLSSTESSVSALNPLAESLKSRSDLPLYLPNNLKVIKHTVLQQEPRADFCFINFSIPLTLLSPCDYCVELWGAFTFIVHAHHHLESTVVPSPTAIWNMIRHLLYKLFCKFKETSNYM